MINAEDLVRGSINYNGWDPSSIFGSNEESHAVQDAKNTSLQEIPISLVGSAVHADELNYDNESMKSSKEEIPKLQPESKLISKKVSTKDRKSKTPTQPANKISNGNSNIDAKESTNSEAIHKHGSDFGEIQNNANQDEVTIDPPNSNVPIMQSNNNDPVVDILSDSLGYVNTEVSQPQSVADILCRESPDMSLQNCVPVALPTATGNGEIDMLCDSLNIQNVSTDSQRMNDITITADNVDNCVESNSIQPLSNAVSDSLDAVTMVHHIQSDPAPAVAMNEDESSIENDSSLLDTTPAFPSAHDDDEVKVDDEQVDDEQVDDEQVDDEQVDDSLIITATMLQDGMENLGDSVEFEKFPCTSSNVGHTGNVNCQLDEPKQDSISEAKESSVKQTSAILTQELAATRIQSVVRGRKGRKRAGKLQLAAERDKKKQREIKQQESQKKFAARIDAPAPWMPSDALNHETIEDNVIRSNKEIHIDDRRDNDDAMSDDSIAPGQDEDEVIVYKANRKDFVATTTPSRNSFSMVNHVPECRDDNEIENNMYATPQSSSKVSSHKLPDTVVASDTSNGSNGSNGGSGKKPSSKLPVKSTSKASSSSQQQIQQQHQPHHQQQPRQDSLQGNHKADSTRKTDDQPIDPLPSSQPKRHVDSQLHASQPTNVPISTSQSPYKTKPGKASLVALSHEIDQLDGLLTTVFEVDDEDNMDKTGAIVKIPGKLPNANTSMSKKGKEVKQMDDGANSSQMHVKANRRTSFENSYQDQYVYDVNSNDELLNDDDNYDGRFDIIEDSLEEEDMFDLEAEMNRKIDESLFATPFLEDESESKAIDTSKIRRNINSREQKLLVLEMKRSTNHDSLSSNPGNNANNSSNSKSSIGGVPTRYAAKLAGLENMAPIPKPLSLSRPLVSAPPSTTIVSPVAPDRDSSRHQMVHPKSCIAPHRVAGTGDIAPFSARSNYDNDDDNTEHYRQRIDDTPIMRDSIELAPIAPHQTNHAAKDSKQPKEQPTTTFIVPKKPSAVGVRVGGSGPNSFMHENRTTSTSADVYLPSVNDLLNVSPEQNQMRIDANNAHIASQGANNPPNKRTAASQNARDPEPRQMMPVDAPITNESKPSNLNLNPKRRLFGGDDESIQSDRSGSRGRGRQQLGYGEKFEVERERSSSRNRNRGIDTNNAGKDNRIISKANIQKREERVQAVTTIQRVFRGFQARLQAWKRREMMHQIDRYKCKNCGRLEQGGLYCKGCGRRTSHGAASKKPVPPAQKQNQQVQQPLPLKQLQRPPDLQPAGSNVNVHQSEASKPRKPHGGVETQFNPGIGEQVGRRQQQQQQQQQQQPSGNMRPIRNAENSNIRISHGTQEELQLLKELEELDSKARKKILAMKAAGDDLRRRDDAIAGAAGAVAGDASRVVGKKSALDPEIVKEKMAFKAGAKDVRSAALASQLAMKKEEKEREKQRVEQWKRAQAEQQRLLEEQEAAERDRIRLEQEMMIEKEKRDREEAYEASKYKSSYLNQFAKKSSGASGDGRGKRRGKFADDDAGSIGTYSTNAGSAVGAVASEGGRHTKHPTAGGRGGGGGGPRVEETSSLPPLLPAIGPRQIASQGDRTGGKLLSAEYETASGKDTSQRRIFNPGNAAGADSRTKTMSAPPRYIHDDIGDMSPVKGQKPKEILKLPPPVRVSHDYGPVQADSNANPKKKQLHKK